MESNKPFRVALVRAASSGNLWEPSEPAGIEALMAILCKNEIECHLFDREMESMDRIVEQIVAYKPSLLGLSVLMEDNAFDAARLLSRVRNKVAVPCVIGGLFVTTNYERASALFPSDVRLVAGEGEAALLKICAEMNGLSYPNMGKPYLSPNEWPWLWRHRLQDYLNYGAPITMRSSRGCPGQCSFCITPSLPNGLNTWQGREISDVAEEMAQLSKLYHPPAFNFIDDDFGSLARVEELVDALAQRNIKCAFSLQMRANSIYSIPNYARIFQKIKKGGLYYLFFGIESLNEKTLVYFNKHLNPIKALDAAQTIRKLGIAINIGYILWHPQSTLESIKTEAITLHDAGFFTTKLCLSRLMLSSSCKLLKENNSFPKNLEDRYNMLYSAIAPLYDAWTAGSMRIPWLYSAAQLESTEKVMNDIIEFEKGLCQIYELTFRIFMDDGKVSTELINDTARSTRERFHEIGSTYFRTR